MLRHLAQSVPSPDMSWLQPVITRAILAAQLFITALLGLPLLKTWGAAALGGPKERMEAKESTGDRAMWFVLVWLVGGVLLVLNWVVGR